MRRPSSMKTDSHNTSFYGRRKGKSLRARQAGLYDLLLPSVRVDLEVLASGIASLCFDASKPVWLEIGFGGGEHLTSEAMLHPDVNFIGCEPFVNGVAKLLACIDQSDIENVRIYDEEVVNLIEVLPDASIDQVSILYPDPWPKLRHKKRRLISSDFLVKLARVMKSGSQLRFATDIDDYAGWTLSRIEDSPSFSWNPVSSQDWRLPWENWPGTRYEAKALREGRTPVYLTFYRH
jgi:tRNA (guanine-N7-)-methyltransferase